MRSFLVSLKQIISEIQYYEIYVAVIDTLQYSWNGFLQALRQLNAQYNPLIHFPKEDPLIISHANQCKADSYLNDSFAIFGVILLTSVIIKYIWINRKEKNKTLENIQIQVDKEKIPKKRDYNKLKELYRILRALKYSHYTAVQENKMMSPSIMRSLRDIKRRRIRGRSRYSDVSKQQAVNDDSDKYANIQESVHEAIRILEEEIDYKSDEESDADIKYKDLENMKQREEIDEVLRYFENQENTKNMIRNLNANHGDIESWLRFWNSNKYPPQFSEKKICGKTFVSDDINECQPSKTCLKCSKEEEATLFLQQTMDNKPVLTNALTEYRKVDPCKKCSNPADTQNTLKLNLMDLQPSALQRNLTREGEKFDTSNKSEKGEKKVLSVNANKNALSIEILFNRNIQLN